MIDWLDFTIEVQHETIENGRYMAIEYDGEIVFESNRMRKVEGSYSSTVQVTSRSSEDFYSKAFIELGLYTGNDTGGQSSAISFFGNPVKYLQGHNVIGSDCYASYAKELVLDVLPKLGVSQSVIDECVKKIEEYNFWITRIDITEMIDLGTDKDVNAYLDMMPLTVKARGDRCDYTKSTFYVGKHSGLWTLKFYNKFKELTSRSKHHKLNSLFTDTGLLEFSRGKLRAELTLRKKQLDRLKVTHASKLKNSLRSLYKQHLEKMTMTNQIADIDALYELSDCYQATYFKWRDGQLPKHFLPKSTFYDHKKVLKAIGIDISLPPIEASERTVNIEPLHKVLEPKIVNWHDVPAELMLYVVQPLQSNHLRVA